MLQGEILRLFTFEKGNSAPIISWDVHSSQIGKDKNRGEEDQASGGERPVAVRAK
jgi:hypothetical protein